MKRDETDSVELAPEERAFVARVAALSEAPAPDPARRVAFQQALDRRLARRGGRPAWPAWLGAAACAVLLVVGVRAVRVGAPAPPAETPGQRAVVATAPSAVEALLVLGEEGEPQGDDALPDDYLAIAGLILGG